MFGLFALALAQNDLVAGLLNRHQIGGNRLRVAALEAERRHVRVPDHQTLAQPGDERLEIHRAREPPERWSIGVAALPRRANGMTPGTGLLDLGVAALDLAELGTGGTGRAMSASSAMVSRIAIPSGRMATLGFARSLA